MKTTKIAYALIAACSIAMAGVQATDVSAVGLEASAVAIADHGLTPVEQSPTLAAR